MMTKLVSHIPNRTRGQSLVEFALTATIMIFLLLATIDFGLAFFSWITLRDAAQEGATYASIFPPASDSVHINVSGSDEVNNIKARVKGAATTPVNLASNTALPLDHIDIRLVDGTPCPGNGVQVTVTYDYHVITPMISNFINSPTIPVSATVTNTILRKSNTYTGTCP